VTRTVVAFDFDGTLTRRDTLIPFLVRVCGRAAVLRASASVGSRFATTLSLDMNTLRGGLKDQLLVRLLAGRPASELVLAGQRYAHQLLADRLRSSSYQLWEHHAAAGHELVIVSASLEVYVDPLARLLGGRAGLGSRLEVVDGLLTGHLDGPNNRGPEKVRRLDEWLRDTAADPRDAGDPEDVEVFAYGDSSGDDELLARADHGVRVAHR